MFQKLILLAICIISISSENIQVKTTEGIIEGFRNSSGAYFFAIPYSEPPVGELRFKPPTPKTPWEGTLQTKVPKFSCIQPSPKATPTNEDCLYLNVHVPPGNLKDLPVMMWIHGGSNTHGNGDLYDGDSMSSVEKVIVVTINYRLGLFGFLFTPELNAEAPSGLYGMLDQAAAIQWIVRNIEKFGGNPLKVTLFGESAGGTGVLYHLTAPHSPRFQRAIVQSGPLTTHTPNKATQLYSEVLRKLNCTTNVPACLRAAPVAEILKVQRSLTTTALKDAPLFRPVLHPTMFPLDFMDALKQGRFHRVPILMGANLDEASYFLCPQYENLNLAQYYAFLGLEFGFERAIKIAQKYNANSFPSVKDCLSTLLTDFIFRCPALDVVRETSKHVNSYLYSYEYFAGFSNNCNRVSHAYELPFLFNKFMRHYFRGYQLSPKEIEFSNLMKKTWVEFASDNVQNWVKYTDKNSFILNQTITQAQNFRGDYCDFWSTITTERSLESVQANLKIVLEGNLDN